MPPQPPLTLFTEQIDTPIGLLWLLTDEQDQVRALDWMDHDPRMRQLLRRHYGADGTSLCSRPKRSPAAVKLVAYFRGQLSAIDSISVACHGTPFQRQVWQALRRIPTGSTLSYSGLAAAIGRPSAVRAVGLANGANPIGVIVPCHRVIGADSSLTGYGGGLERKRWLLEHEHALGAQSALSLVISDA